MKIWYDRDGDMLEVIFERRTPDGRIVGMVVLNFSKHDRESLTLPVAVTAVDG